MLPTKCLFTPTFSVWEKMEPIFKQPEIKNLNFQLILKVRKPRYTDSKTGFVLSQM